jgi:hypothetical protein
MIHDQYDHAVRIFLRDQFYPKQKQIFYCCFFSSHILIPVVELYVKRQSSKNYVKGYFIFYDILYVFFILTFLFIIY